MFDCFQESITPTASIEPMIEEIANDEDLKKDDVISTSATATPPVQEIRYQSNQYVNSTNSSVTPTLSVMGYAPPPAFTAPMETGGTIYHTGVRNRQFLEFKTKQWVRKFKTFLLFYTLSSSFFSWNISWNSEAGRHFVCPVTTCDVLICYVHGM